MASREPELPNVAVLLASLLQRVPAERQPLLIALAERLAAARYRGWAADATVAAHAADLRACAAREEDIATSIEGLYADAATVQAELRAQHPELMDINQSLFAQRPLHQQFAIQAQGERLGAATWRSLARQTSDRHRAEILERCAELEEASAVVLEAIRANPIAG
jgi:hypothetical protein